MEFDTKEVEMRELKVRVPDDFTYLQERAILETIEFLISNEYKMRNRKATLTVFSSIMIFEITILVSLILFAIN